MFIELESTFEGLYEKFLAGTKWLNDNWRRGDIRKHIEEFKSKIMDPMDKTWSQLSDKEKKNFLSLF